MLGTAIFTWHDGKLRYDEVRWEPVTHSREQAAKLARTRLLQDVRATRVQVEYAELEFEEVTREVAQGRRLRRSA